MALAPDAKLTEDYQPVMQWNGAELIIMVAPETRSAQNKTLLDKVIWPLPQEAAQS